MRNIIKAGAVAAASVVGCVALAGTATAVAWGSQSNPVYGYDGSAAFGKVYGNFYNENSTYARSSSYQYDLQPGGNDVRVETDYYFYEFSPTCAQGGAVCWSFDVSRQTDPTDDAKWVYDYRRRGLHGGASAARGGINICEIQAWSNDPCSAHAWVSFTY